MRRSTTLQNTQLLNEHQAAARLNLSVATLRRWRWAGQGPRFLKIGGAVRYDSEDLEMYIQACRRRSTSDEGGHAHQRG